MAMSGRRCIRQLRAMWTCEPGFSGRTAACVLHPPGHEQRLWLFEVGKIDRVPAVIRISLDDGEPDAATDRAMDAERIFGGNDVGDARVAEAEMPGFVRVPPYRERGDRTRRGGAVAVVCDFLKEAHA